MSSGIYVLKTKDGYRVNFSDRYYDFFGNFDDSKCDYIPNAKAIEEVFGFCEAMTVRSDAFQKALDISNSLGYDTFDGITEIRNYQNMTFEELTNG